MTRTVDTYIEFGVRMAHDDTTAAWVFELPFWGYCGQGASEDEALSALVERLPSGCRCEVVERVYGDEQAFARDHLPAIAAERDATLADPAADVLARRRYGKSLVPTDARPRQSPARG